MEKEINYLISFYNAKERIIKDYKFYEAKYKKNDIIISLTKVGIKNSDIASIIGIETYHPDIIINTGTCGSHNINLHPNTIVVANQVIYLNDKDIRLRIDSTKELLEKINDENVQFVNFGSGEIFNIIQENIIKLKNRFEHDTEDMESISSFFECQKHNIKHIAIRIVTNNELKDEFIEDYIEVCCKNIQVYITEYIDKLI